MIGRGGLGLMPAWAWYAALAAAFAGEHTEGQAIALPSGRSVMLEAPAPTVPDDDGEFAFPPPSPPAARPEARPDRLAIDNFDRWIFGEGVGDRAKLRHLDRALVVRLERAGRAYRLDPAHRAKLHLAGRGDIKHFLDRVNRRRTAFDAVRADLGAGIDALQRLDPLRDEFRAGPFGPGSLFAKTLARIEADRPAATGP